MRSFMLLLALAYSLVSPAALAQGSSISVDSAFEVVMVKLGHDADIRLLCGEGVTFSFAQQAANKNRRTTIAMMNGGMYQQSSEGSVARSVGLCATGGNVIDPIITTNGGAGNFFMSPGPGVFWTSKNGIAHVSPAANFRFNTNTMSLATQSGPLLLVNGKPNPAFSSSSSNRLIRNAIGVTPDGKTAYLVISKKPVTFYELAAYFIKKGCNQALYLDGVVSKFWTDGSLPSDRFGSVLLVTVPKK